MAVVSADKLYFVSNHMRSFLGTLKNRRVSSENYQWRYLEGGNPTNPKVLFVHGFMGSKALWRSIMQHMVEDYHVIAVDMPGLHTGLKTVDERYDFPEMAACLHEFVSALGVEAFHLLGHSLGANVCAVYAARYQKRIRSLAVISLLAIDQKNPMGHLTRFSEFKQHLMCRTTEGLRSLMSMLYFRPPNIPDAILKYKLKEIETHRGFYHNVLTDMESSMLFLLKSLQYLPSKTLVVNGVDDVFLTDASLSLVRQHVSDVRVRNLPECGHVPFLEKPRQLARLYMDYLNEARNQGYHGAQIAVDEVG